MHDSVCVLVSPRPRARRAPALRLARRGTRGVPAAPPARHPGRPHRLRLRRGPVDGCPRRAASPRGSPPTRALELFPKLSPDGRTVAFTAEYDGNMDAFTVPVEGGEPQRLTWHPVPDQVAEWYPDGKALLLRSAPRLGPDALSTLLQAAGRAAASRSCLPLPTAGYATLSPDGSQIAYVSPAYDNRTWKRYKGGNAPTSGPTTSARTPRRRSPTGPAPTSGRCGTAARSTTAPTAADARANLWAYDLDTKHTARSPRSTEYDVKWPSVGSDAIVFENGG